ncbi:MAG: M61 family metallopeptidase [Cyclobacteriaceae bacterium]|nr:M61 family metallopeptidase [Cyclobacteriaceae bacterium]
MKRFHFWSLFLIIAILCIAYTGTYAKVEVLYKLSMPEPQTHYLEVEIQLSGYDKQELLLKMPVWAPGSYLIREFPRHIEGFHVETSTGKSLQFSKTNKNSWQIINGRNSSLVIRYRVYAFDLTVRTSFVDEDFAFVNGSNVFMYADYLRNLPARLIIHPHKNWEKISTGLQKEGESSWIYKIQNYDELADSPIQIGNHEVFTFNAAGVEHELAMVGPGNYNSRRIISDLSQIAEVCTEIFGENPNKRFVYIVHNLDRRGGGLEHMNSTVLQVDRWSYGPENSYLNFLSLAAHEYFHLWLVKRLRPAAFIPYDYDQEQYTPLLWVMEGFVSYYDDLILKRAGLMSEREYLRRVALNFSTLMNTPGRKVQSVAASSFDTWIKFYRRDENSNNSQVSYYNKGAVLATLLDLEIISNSMGKHRLNDVLKEMYQQFYKRKDAGINENDVKKYLERYAGKDLGDFFESYIYGTDEIDFEKYFEKAGLNLFDLNSENKSASLGFSFQYISANMVVRTVLRDGPAWKSGINVDDEILAIDGFRVRNDTFSKLMQNYKAGDEVKILLSRSGIIHEITCQAEKSTEVEYILQKTANPEKLPSLVFEKWLSR